MSLWQRAKKQELLRTQGPAVGGALTGRLCGHGCSRGGSGGGDWHDGFQFENGSPGPDKRRRTLCAASAACNGVLSLPPPGPAPEGKVWSAEHGHWHDAPGAGGQVVTTSGTTITPAGPAAPTPQPPGPVPEGKVWSPEHGHWHDVPGAAGQSVVTSGTTVVSGTPSTAAARLAAGQAPGGRQPLSRRPRQHRHHRPPSHLLQRRQPRRRRRRPLSDAPTAAPDAAAPASPK